MIIGILKEVILRFILCLWMVFSLEGKTEKKIDELVMYVCGCVCVHTCACAHMGACAHIVGYRV